MELSRKFLRCLTMKKNKMIELEDNCGFNKNFCCSCLFYFELMKGRYWCPCCI